MRSQVAMIVVFALVTAGCSSNRDSAPTSSVVGEPSGSTTEQTVPATSPETSTTATTTTTSAATTTTHTPLWLTVKYRSDPVDVASPRFVYLDGGSSSLVDAAFYDASNEYMIISLDGTAYHYCGMPSSTWTQFAAASSLGSFYDEQIKGRFDCRIGVVPEY